MVLLQMPNVLNANKYKMRTESYQLFAQLLEGHVNEASTSLNIITGSPGGQQVVKKLHADMGLAHDQDYKSVDKISWSELKDAYRGAWVIIIGPKGTGAIRARNGSYEALASTGEEVQSKSDSRGGNILDFLKANIGKLQKFYVGKNTTTVSDKQKKRASSQQGLSTEVTNDTLIKKFKPLWARAITAAIADVKGHVANMIKNDAFAKAQRKLTHIESLQRGLEDLEAGGTDTPDFIRTALNTSVLMAASHHYPEQTGNVTKGYRGYNSERPEGPSQLLKDIAAGDQKKLGTVLGFFKRALISG